MSESISARNLLSRETIHRLVDELFDLQQKTDPAVCAFPEDVEFRGARVGKNSAATEAIGVAALVYLSLAGWAVAHRAGRVLHAETSQTTSDTHTLEENGASFLSSHDHRELAEAAVCRAVVRSFLEPFAPHSIAGLFMFNVISGLEALDHGEAYPMFRPAKTQRHGQPYSLARYMLSAVECVHYLNGNGMQMEAARDKVAQAFGVSWQTVRSWETRDLRAMTWLGDLQEIIKVAHRAGELDREPNDWAGDATDILALERSLIFSSLVGILPVLGRQYRLGKSPE